VAPGSREAITALEAVVVQPQPERQEVPLMAARVDRELRGSLMALPERVVVAVAHAPATRLERHQPVAERAEYRQRLEQRAPQTPEAEVADRMSPEAVGPVDRACA